MGLGRRRSRPALRRGGRRALLARGLPPREALLRTPPRSVLCQPVRRDRRFRVRVRRLLLDPNRDPLRGAGPDQPAAGPGAHLDVVRGVQVLPVFVSAVASGFGQGPAGILQCRAGRDVRQVRRGVPDGANTARCETVDSKKKTDLEQRHLQCLQDASHLSAGPRREQQVVASPIRISGMLDYFLNTYKLKGQRDSKGGGWVQ